MAFYDRVVEGTTFEWTICNNGRAEPEEGKGNSFYIKLMIFFVIIDAFFYEPKPKIWKFTTSRLFTPSIV